MAANTAMFPMPVNPAMAIPGSIKIYKYIYTLAPDRANIDFITLSWCCAACVVSAKGVYCFVSLGLQLLFQQHAYENENGLGRELGCLLLERGRFRSAVVPLHVGRCRSARNAHVGDVWERQLPHVRLWNQAQQLSLDWSSTLSDSTQVDDLTQTILYSFRVNCKTVWLNSSWC